MFGWISRAENWPGINLQRGRLRSQFSLKKVESEFAFVTLCFKLFFILKCICLRYLPLWDSNTYRLHTLLVVLLRAIECLSISHPVDLSLLDWPSKNLLGHIQVFAFLMWSVAFWKNFGHFVLPTATCTVGEGRSITWEIAQWSYWQLSHILEKIRALKISWLH